MKSALYTGTVRHRRFLPTPNHFHYKVYMVYLDLSELAQVFSLSPFWSMKRPAPAWLKRGDFLGVDTEQLDSKVREIVHAETGEEIRGPIRLLTNLRYFGFLMNPISCYYCFDQDETLRYVVAEVTNTPWREKIPYVIPCQAGSRVHRHRFSKGMHVSPFMPMDQQYQWSGNLPDNKLAVHLENLEGEQKLFDATLSLRRQEMTAASLNAVLLRHPFMSLKIAAGIYWQALRLFIKRVPLHKHPEPVRREQTKEKESSHEIA